MPTYSSLLILTITMQFHKAKSLTQVLLALALLALALFTAACDKEQALPDSTSTPGQISVPTTTTTKPLSTPTLTTAPSLTPSKEPSPSPSPTRETITFDGESAYEFLLEQMKFSPSWPGSPGHMGLRGFIAGQVLANGWQLEQQSFEFQGVDGLNLIARGNMDQGRIIILGAHYDTRKIADQTPGSMDPVPGAVDGASGVAVLLELARTLEMEDVDHEIWLAFFDLEDQGSGGMPDFPYIVGSTYMAANLRDPVYAMVLVDMVGDADQQLYYEKNSDPVLRAILWQTAADLGYDAHFIPEPKYRMLDDHIPFIQLGIPSVDIIDFDYPFWHTIEDTADKASPESLERVGRTLEEWLERR